MNNYQRQQARKQQRQDGGENPLALLAGLGLNVDPMQQLGGLVNLVNQLGEADRWEAEFGLREQAGQLDQQRIQQQDAQFQQQMDQSEMQQQQAQENWGQEYGLQKLTAEQNRAEQIKQFEFMKGMQQKELIAAVLGIPARFQDSFGQMSQSISPAGLQSLIPAESGFNVADFYSQQQPAGFDPTANMTAEQRIQYQARLAAGLPPIQ